ncbi:MAG TPA: aconitate hydratase AcnA [Gemmataceae bacterium]|nr:aconitate hydratase AcnA [Gemmataceae bacterium]
MANTFGSQSTLQVDGQSFTIHRLAVVDKQLPQAGKLPFSLRILLENLLRNEDGQSVRADDITALAKWDAKAEPTKEIAFMPARVLMQDFTGVPAIVDLAAMRDAIVKLGGDPKRINPLQPAELVIDHSVQVDEFGTAAALLHNSELEYQRNRERYLFLRWGQEAFRNFKVVPPETGICHQVNLEYLARVVFTGEVQGKPAAYPDTVVGTDSHTTMINGLGVLGWGVGGIEAEAAMLGQPVSMLIPQVVGFKLRGQLPAGATATDLVLTVTQILRKKGVVGKFVEFHGEGLAALPLADRATIANMAPEYGATCGIFPVDAETLRYLRFTGRSESQVKLVEAYCKEQGLFHTATTPAANYSEVLELDLASVEPSMAGPSRPQDRVRLADVKSAFARELPALQGKSKTKPLPTLAIAKEISEGSPTAAPPSPPPPPQPNADGKPIHDGSVVIAAITSCTNTSNPSVMLGAGLLAQKAAARGLKSKPWVKTSLAPGSKVVTEYLKQAGVLRSLEQLGFYLAGYGCTTCIGNSGPLPTDVSKQIEANNLVVAAVLSGNRNFEGRVHAEVRANYLASPPLVVAYALAGDINIDLTKEPIGVDSQGKSVMLKEIWPTPAEVHDALARGMTSEMFRQVYGDVFKGNDSWAQLPIPKGDRYQWDAQSTYVKNPPYFDGMGMKPAAITDIKAARVLLKLGDSITTDHISPAGSIKASSPAGKYLAEHGVQQKDFNSYGSRRGNHEVMMRGTFANVRIKNQLVPGIEGGVTRHLPDGEQMSVFDAAMKYQKDNVPLIVLAGKEYGSGSSRDWAAKGPRLLGVRAVIAESYERIHRSNLVGMGVLPLQFLPGENPASLGLTGEELFDIDGVAALGNALAGGKQIAVKARRSDGGEKLFKALVRIDTPQEVHYYQHGGILPFVLRQLVNAK